LSSCFVFYRTAAIYILRLCLCCRVADNNRVAEAGVRDATMAGNASRGEIRRQLNSMTECAICSETYDDPRILPCVHTYCFKCIDGFCGRKSPGEKAECPLCRNEFEIPKSGVAGLRKNFIVEQLKEVADMSNDRCEGSCSGARKPPTLFCVECGRRLCETCADSHCRSRSTHTHKLVKLNEGGEVSELPAKMNKRSDLPEVADECRKQMRENAELLAGVIAVCLKAIEERKQDKGELSRRFSGVEREICDRAEWMKEQIEREKHKLLKDAESFKNDRIKRIDNVIGEVEQQVSLAQTLAEHAEELANHGVADDVTKNARNVHDRTVELLKLDGIQRAVSELGSFDVIFTPATWPKQSSGNVVGDVRVDKKNGINGDC